VNTKITFATNTGPNTLEHTKLLLKSLQQNLDNKHHEILVFIDSDNDGTFEYLKSIKKDFYDLKIVTHKINPVVGPERNCNLIVDLAKYDVVSYLQNDMVVSKHYDTQVLDNLEDNMILSSTRIEPPLHGESHVTFTYDFGLSPNEFNFNNFVEYAETIKSNKHLEYFFAPYTFHKTTWNKLGGYDTLFRRSRCDSDLVQRCMHLGIKLKQTYAANVYHFTCTSSRGKDWFKKDNQSAQHRVKLQELADQIELRRFVKKWGNFNHGETVLTKYDCDLVIKTDNEELMINAAYRLEPYFSKVWVKAQSMIDKLISMHLLHHDPANELYGFTNQTWNDSKHLYNHIDYSKVYLLGSPKEYNCCIGVDLDSKETNLLTNENLLNLSEIIRQTPVGDYESGNCIVSIKNLVNTITDFKVTNPSFDYSLLTIS
jgi:hypothetical protein